MKTIGAALLVMVFATMTSGVGISAPARALSSRSDADRLGTTSRPANSFPWKKPGAELQVVSWGERVDLSQVAERGRYTIVDFYAPWSPAGVTLSPEVASLAASARGRVVVKRVSVKDWKSPVLDQYDVRALPFFVVFDPAGRIIARGLDAYRLSLRLLGSPSTLARSARHLHSSVSEVRRKL